MAIEKVVLPQPAYPFKPRNRYKVPVKQWAKWPDVARAVFNSTHEQMIDSQRAFKHPKQEPMPRAHWKTLAWNAAWIAADNVRDCLRSWAAAA